MMLYECATVSELPNYGTKLPYWVPVVVPSNNPITVSKEFQTIRNKKE